MRNKKWKDVTAGNVYETKQKIGQKLYELEKEWKCAETAIAV